MKLESLATAITGMSFRETYPLLKSAAVPNLSDHFLTPLMILKHGAGTCLKPQVACNIYNTHHEPRRRLF